MVHKNYIQVDPEVLRADFNRRPFEFRHDLSSHPLLQLEALFDLAARLPPAEVLHWSGAIGIGDNIDGSLPEGDVRSHRGRPVLHPDS